MRCVMVALVLLALATAFAQVDGMVVIPLKWADASYVGALLGGEPPSAKDLTASRQEWVNHFAQTLARTLPRDLETVQPRWTHGATAFASVMETVGQGRGPGLPLPEGLAGPPVVLAPQNALMVRGTPAAIDQLRELIAILDVKPRMVNVEARLVDAPTSRTDEWGIDFGRRIADVVIGSTGNMPAGGLQVMRGDGKGFAAAGIDQRESRGQSLTAASVLATNNTAAVITLGRMLPYVSSRVSYDEAGRRYVDTSVEAVFIGTELFVQPRISNNDTVTMLIRPTFIEAVGTVIGPNGSALPITQTLGTETVVTVPDGGTVQIAGFERSLDEYNTRFSGILKAINSRVESHPALFVTPRIVRDLEEQRR